MAREYMEKQSDRRQKSVRPDHYRAEGRCLVLDFPGAVRLTAGGAVGFFGLSADIHRLGIFPAIFSGRGLIGARRRNRAGVTAVRVVPGRGRTDLLGFQCILGGLGHRGFIGIVEGLADLAADEGAEQGADGNRREFALAATDLGAGNGTTDSTEQTARGLLGSKLLSIVRAGPECQGGYDDKYGRSFHL